MSKKHTDQPDWDSPPEKDPAPEKAAPEKDKVKVVCISHLWTQVDGKTLEINQEAEVSKETAEELVRQGRVRIV
jgi:hypothetical protein